MTDTTADLIARAREFTQEDQRGSYIPFCRASDSLIRELTNALDAAREGEMNRCLDLVNRERSKGNADLRSLIHSITSGLTAEQIEEF